MMAFNDKEFYEKEIDFCNSMIGFDERFLERIKEQLKRERAVDKEMVEYVWNKGVVTKFEMETYHKDYKRGETEKLEKEARRVRKSLRKYKAKLAVYEEKLANLV